jgi:hypothetical protein
LSEKDGQRENGELRVFWVDEEDGEKLERLESLLLGHLRGTWWYSVGKYMFRKKAVIKGTGEYMLFINLLVINWNRDEEF